MVENYRIASHYSFEQFDLISRIHWQQNRASPFGLIFHYASVRSECFRRRCLKSHQPQLRSSQPLTRINFSRQNVRNLTEPICWMVPQSLTAEQLLDNTAAVKQKLFGYYQKKGGVTEIQITLDTFTSLSNTFSAIIDLNLVRIKRGCLPTLELKLDNSLERAIEFSSVPLVFS